MPRDPEARYLTVRFKQDSPVLKAILAEAQRSGQTPTTIIEMRMADYYFPLQRKQHLTQEEIADDFSSLIAGGWRE